MSERIKILPILIMVAMLAFSVRLVEVYSGFKDLSGAAYAAAEKQTPVDAQAELEKLVEEDASKEEMPAEDMLVAANDTETKDGQPETQAETETEEDDMPEPPSMEDSKWMDASDSDFDVTGVKMEMFKDMSARRQELDKRERALVTREALLRAAEQELDRKYQEMAELRGEIESLLEKQSEEEQARIQSLVKIYEGMKPKEAARIFDTLDLDVLVSVMSRMSERKLSPVLASMNPERARTVTIVLAEEKQLPELPDN